MVVEAINQGVAINAIKRGTKLEKALTTLADRLVPAMAVAERRKS